MSARMIRAGRSRPGLGKPAPPAVRSTPWHDQAVGGGRKEPSMALRFRQVRRPLSKATSFLVPILLALALAPPRAAASSGWEVVSSPAVPSGELLAVGGSSPTDVWAVGSWFKPSTSSFLSLAMHWDGT